MQRNDQSGDEDSASSFNAEEDQSATGSVTLTVCRSHESKSFSDNEAISKHLAKKLKSIEQFTSLDCRNTTLYYQASDYLADLIKSRGTRPLQKIDLSGAFFEHETMEPEEIANSINTFFNAIEQTGIVSLVLSRNELNQSSAHSIAVALPSLSTLQELNLTKTLIR